MKLSKDFLIQKYIEQGLTVTDIMKETDTTKYQVKTALRRFGIRKKPLKLGNEKYDDRDWLFDQYMIKGKGYTVIANECHVSYTTILDRILYFGWPLRGHTDIDKGAPRRGTKHSDESLIKIRNTRVKNRVQTKCNYCGKSLEVRVSKYKKYSHMYCDQDCFHSFLEENRVEPENVTDSAEYKQWRLKVYKRDVYRCKMPGCHSNSRDIAAHHIYPKKVYPEKNLM